MAATQKAHRLFATGQEPDAAAGRVVAQALWQAEALKAFLRGEGERPQAAAVLERQQELAAELVSARLGQQPEKRQRAVQAREQRVRQRRPEALQVRLALERAGQQERQRPAQERAEPRARTFSTQPSQQRLAHPYPLSISPLRPPRLVLVPES